MDNSETQTRTLPDAVGYGNGVIGLSAKDIREVNSFKEELVRSADVLISRESKLGQIAESILGRMPKSFVIPSVAAVALIVAACGGNSSKSINTPVNSPTSGIETQAPAQVSPTLSSTPEIKSTTQPSPLEQAIQSGKLELAGQEWTKYFITITPEEAEALLAKENQGIGNNPAKMKYLLPFDPRFALNLQLTDVKVTIGNTLYKMLGINNIPVGTIFYTPVSGTAETNQNIAGGGVLIAEWSIVDKNNIAYAGVFPREGSKTFVPVGNPSEVTIGTPLISFGTQTTLPSSLYGGDYHALYGLGLEVIQTDNGSISQLLVKDGKIAFIANDK